MKLTDEYSSLQTVNLLFPVIFLTLLPASCSRNYLYNDIIGNSPKNSTSFEEDTYESENNCAVQCVKGRRTFNKIAIQARSSISAKTDSGKVISNEPLRVDVMYYPGQKRKRTIPEFAARRTLFDLVILRLIMSDQLRARSSATFRDFCPALSDHA